MLITDIFSLQVTSFEEAALHLFRLQYDGCPPYRRFVQTLHTAPENVDTISKIPFLPVSFFRSEKVIMNNNEAYLIFESSGTSSADTSKHYIANAELYNASLQQGFECFYGSLSGYCILALLPHYLERSHSSLVYMVRQWMEASGHPECGFFINDTDVLYQHLLKLRQRRQNVVLIGITFALLDFAGRYKLSDFPELIVMETGGMKGRHTEIVRQDLHKILRSAFSTPQIHSEYGMTELLSQAYSAKDGIFYAPPWMKILIYDPLNPFAYLPAGKVGGIVIIDLANQYSCAFVQTQDKGRLLPCGGFEVLGRMSSAPLRGCNMLTE